jgi:hypothetical protein
MGVSGCPRSCVESGLLTERVFLPYAEAERIPKSSHTLGNSSFFNPYKPTLLNTLHA